MIRTFQLILALELLGSCLVPDAMADWLQFRGPAGNGHLGQMQHPLKWSAEQNLAWSQPLPGAGWSSPIVVGARVFVTAAVDAANTKPLGFTGGVRNMRGKKPTQPLDFKLTCLSLQDGSVLWSTRLAREQPQFPIHPSNTYATESPTSDGKFIYCYFAAIGTVTAVDLEGNIAWSTQVGAFPSGNGFGTGSSLTRKGNRLFLQCDNDEASFIVALDTTNGKEAWKRERSSRTSWSTPFVWEHGARTDLVVCGSGTVSGYELTTGKTIWKLTNVSSSFTASPASDAEYLFFGNSGPASQGPLIAVSSEIEGEVRFTDDELPPGVAWAQKRAGPGMTSPVASGDYLYVCSRGILSCYEAKTGNRVYRSRLPKAKSIAASSWADENHLFLLDESGKTFVVKTGAEFNVVAENQLDDLFWSTPAITQSTLLLRGAEKLYCIRASTP